MFHFSTKKIIVIIFILTHIGWLNVDADELYFIDAHSQIDHKVLPLNKIISLMNRAGVRQTILSARGNLKGKTLLKLSKENSGRIMPAVRTKGKPYDTGSKKYYELLKKQVATKQYPAIAEVLLYHAKKGNKAPEVIVYPDDKRVKDTLNYAIKNNWPFVVHIEFASLQGKNKKKLCGHLSRCSIKTQNILSS